VFDSEGYDSIANRPELIKATLDIPGKSRFEREA